MITCTVTIRNSATGAVHTRYSGIFKTSVDALMDALDIAPAFSTVSAMVARPTASEKPDTEGTVIAPYSIFKDLVASHQPA